MQGCKPSVQRDGAHIGSERQDFSPVEGQLEPEEVPSSASTTTTGLGEDPVIDAAALTAESESLDCTECADTQLDNKTAALSSGEAVRPALETVLQAPDAIPLDEVALDTIAVARPQAAKLPGVMSLVELPQIKPQKSGHALLPLALNHTTGKVEATSKHHRQASLNTMLIRRQLSTLLDELSTESSLSSSKQLVDWAI